MGRGRSKGVKSTNLKSTNQQGGNTPKEKTFSETPVYGKYTQDGLDSEKFFSENSNRDSLISQMSDEEKTIFGYWGMGLFMQGQQYRGFDNMTKEDQKYTRVYDKYLDQATLKEGVVLSRTSTSELVLGAGNKTPSLKALKNMEGRTVLSKGSMSFAAAA